MRGNVFISYRREDTAGHAGRLYDSLKAAFPGGVFIADVQIPPGADFVTTLAQQLAGCAALVALIGPNWTARDRLHDPGDFVRLEISTALKRDISVFPVLVGGAPLPAATALPEDIQPLLRHQILSISDDDWEHGCDRLIRSLEGVLGAAPRPSRVLRWGIGAAGLVIVLALAGVMLVRTRVAGNSSPPTTTPAPANMPVTTGAAVQYDKSVARGYENAAQVMDDVANKIAGAGTDSRPSITGISPSHGRPGDLVTISGANFGTTQDNSTVTFGSEPARVSSWTATSVVVRVPHIPKIISHREVEVAVRVGSNSANIGFTID